MTSQPQGPFQQGWAATPAEHASAAALIQIEAHLRSIRNMMVFFVVITILGGLVGGITVVTVQ